MATDVIPAADLGGKLLSAEELAANPDFSAIPKKIWNRFRGAIVRKGYGPGEVLRRDAGVHRSSLCHLYRDRKLKMEPARRATRQSSARGGRL
jgi:hypothetical protein